MSRGVRSWSCGLICWRKAFRTWLWRWAIWLRGLVLSPLHPTLFSQILRRGGPTPRLCSLRSAPTAATHCVLLKFLLYLTLWFDLAQCCVEASFPLKREPQGPGKLVGGLDLLCRTECGSQGLQSRLTWQTPCISSYVLKVISAPCWPPRPRITVSSSRSSRRARSVTDFPARQKQKPIVWGRVLNTHPQLSNGQGSGELPARWNSGALSPGMASGSFVYRGINARLLLCHYEKRRWSFAWNSKRFDVRRRSLCRGLNSRGSVWSVYNTVGSFREVGRRYLRSENRGHRGGGCGLWRAGSSGSFSLRPRSAFAVFCRGSSSSPRWAYASEVCKRMDCPAWSRADRFLLCGRSRGAQSKIQGKGSRESCKEGCNSAVASASRGPNQEHLRSSPQHGSSAIRATRGAEEDSRSCGRAGVCNPTSGQCSPCVNAIAAVCWIDGISPQGEGSDIKTFPSSAKSQFCIGQPDECAGAGRRDLSLSSSSRRRWRQFGFGSSGTESSFDFLGFPSSARWRSSPGHHGYLIVAVFEGGSESGKTSAGIGKPFWWLLPVSGSECLQEAEACIKGSRFDPDRGRYRLFYAPVSRALWGLWKCSRHWHCPVCFELHHRLCHSRGLGWSQRACSPNGSWFGTSGTRWFKMGSWVSIDAGGRCSLDDVVIPEEPEPSTDWPAESFWESLSSEVGDDCIGIHSRDGLHCQSENGDGKEGSAVDASPSTCSEEEGEVPKSKRRRRRINAAKRRGVGCGSLGDGGCKPSGRYDGGSAKRSEACGAGDLDIGFACYEEGFIRKPCSMFKWSGVVLRHLLRGRTGFSYFVKLCLNCSGPREEASGALFPIPLPPGDFWGVKVDRLGADRRRRAAERRILWLLVVSLNFSECGSSFPSLKDVWRCPGPHHCNVYDRLISLIRACGPGGSFSVYNCGRKSFQLDARFEELRRALQSLGFDGSSFYGQQKAEVNVPVKNDTPELQPYTALVPDRLKLVGEGKWDCREFLSDLFYMPFVEPRINQYDIVPPADLLPDLSKVVKKDVIALCRVWDCRGLLRIFPVENGPDHEWAMAKIFNNRKSETTDRQIGDRRGANYCEGTIAGPSKSLPTAASLLQVCPPRFSHCLVGSVADRRDFYHQFWTTDQRSATNAIFPVLVLKDLEGTSAHDVFMGTFGIEKKRRSARHVAGDQLHLGGKGGPRGVLCGPDRPVVGCFGALYQGDHLGVEFACDAHGRLLEQAGVLRAGSRLSSASPIVDDSVVSGLVIDDFFALSCEPLGLCAEEPCIATSSVEMFSKAKEVYQREGLVGSDDKDVVGALKYKICGGEVNSTKKAVESGVVSLSAPAEKRFALAVLSVVAASWPFTTDALHPCLVGSWISVLQLRRPAMAFVNELFKVIPPKELDPLNPRLRSLPRRAAQEMQLLACLAPILGSNLAVPFAEEILATDASLCKGGIVSADVSSEVSAAVWRSAPKKGENVPMASSFHAVLKSHDVLHEEVGKQQRADLEEVFGLPSGEPVEDGEGLLGEEEASPQRPIGLYYQFIEVCGGSGVVTKALLAMSVVCGPVFDLSFSQQFDLSKCRVVEWLIFMLEQDRLQSFLVSPPCTTFSPAAYPPCRSYECPRGFTMSEKVLVGNRLAFVSLALLMVALRLKKFGLGEQPRRSKMRWLREWRRLVELGAREVWLSSCMFGSIHQKEFGFVGVNMQVQWLHRACSRDHTHVKIEGAWTKPSAVYCDGLAWFLAQFFKDHLEAKQKFEERVAINAGGLEDVLTNDLCAGLQWKVLDDWHWKFPVHINVLEAQAVLKLLKILARRGGDLRGPVFIDSHVVRSCIARGRSSAHSLRSVLKKIAAFSLAFGLYVGARFSPTRLNPADCPTRDYPLPLPCQLVSQDCSSDGLAFLASVCNLRRWTANWCRLALLLCPSILDFHLDTTSCRSYPITPALESEWTFDFDSTLGYPGEGPLLTWIFLISGIPLSVFGAPPVGVSKSHGDALRKAQRAGIVLDDGRRVTQTTSLTREWLLECFVKWLDEKGASFETIVMASPPDIDVLNKLLVEFGRLLFREGKPYYHFCETINAITSRRPVVRRSLQQAWDLAFMWGSHEPAEHHVAMPYQLVIALISAALLWGWDREAAVFALAWGALLRIGEVTDAVRADLILPSDVNDTNAFALLRILEPKTRFRAARHQAAKLEHVDLLQVVKIGFGKLKPWEKLWPLSSATLRSRLSRLLVQLGLPSKPQESPKPMSLASFRPGGATHLMNLTESAELVRRRGRWASFRIMEIYLQEVSASTYLNLVTKEARGNVLLAFNLFPVIFKKIVGFNASKIPPSAWYFLLTQPIKRHLKV